MKILFSILILIVGSAAAQPVAGVGPNFRDYVEKMLREKYGADLLEICPVDSDPVAARVFSDYGSIFVSKGDGRLPRSCILDNESQVRDFQAGMNQAVETIGGVEVTLQRSAMAALQDARREASKRGLSITPRGGAAASTRSYAKTVELWNSRFYPALKHWVGQGRIKAADADAARKAPVNKQVELVLDWEAKGIYFSKDLQKSILYSVAVPGASQHVFMLALDVEQFANGQVREILARHGWFQTVKSDLPHFTYLGHQEKDLDSLGLTSVAVSGHKFWIPNL